MFGVTDVAGAARGVARRTGRFQRPTLRPASPGAAVAWVARWRPGTGSAQDNGRGRPLPGVGFAPGSKAFARPPQPAASRSRRNAPARRTQEQAGQCRSRMRPSQQDAKGRSEAAWRQTNPIPPPRQMTFASFTSGSRPDIGYLGPHRGPAEYFNISSHSYGREKGMGFVIPPQQLEPLPAGCNIGGIHVVTADRVEDLSRHTPLEIDRVPV